MLPKVKATSNNKKYRTSSSSVIKKALHNILPKLRSGQSFLKKHIINLVSSTGKVLDDRSPAFWHKLNSNYKIALGITVVLSIWMGSGIIGKESPPEIDPSQRVNNNIKSVLVKQFFVNATERIVRLSGKSKEERKVSIKAELSAQVDKIIAYDGAEVNQSESILQLEQVEALARLRQAQSQETRAELEYSSQRRLLAQKLTSTATVAKARGDYEASKASASLAQKQFDATKVQVPFAGRVEKIYVAEGDFVQPGQLLADIFDYDPLVVVGDLSELEVGYIKQGAKVDVIFITGEEVEGNVRYVSKNADIDSRTFEVQVEIPNTDKSLRAGVTAELDFHTGLVNAVKIPASIISIDNEGKIGVKGVDENDKVVFYRIDIVKAETNEMWVGGLPDGVKLIIRGFGFVNDDEKVNIQIEKDS